MAEYARKICKRLHAYVRLGTYHGTIRSLTPGVLRIETEMGVIGVLSNTNCLQPFSMTVNATKPFTETDLFEGQKVLFENEKLTFAESEFAVDVSQATDIELSIHVMKSVFLPLDLNIRVRHLIRVVEEGQSTQPMTALVTGGRIDTLCEPIERNLPTLHEAVYEQDLALCRKAGEQLAGFGNGDTPDSDDVLEGYFAGYTALSMALGRSSERTRSITREIASAAAQQTTDLSAALLLQSGEGLVNEDVFRLLQSLFSDVPYRTLIADGKRVSLLTAPSGVNLLVGICLAVQHQYIPARSE